eukprot:c475_g1_i1.p1 GENE.c475_g1_i1~~c475_g1_i1.p1  ORF type:complete len:1386 (+),score=319.13 c475_g1_i1:290-4159(+)
MGHVSLVVADQLYVVFGSNGRKMSNKVFQLDTDTLEWSRVVARGRVPTPRAYHSAVVLDGTVFTFGGFDGHDYLNDLHKWTIFDPKTNETGLWVKAEQFGVVPEIRASAATAVYGRKMYLFGGYEVSIYKNDFFALDLDTLHWSRIHLTSTTSCPMPGQRAMASLTLVGTKLVLFGGIFCASNGTCVELNDVHHYDIFKSDIRTMDGASGTLPPARYGHSATLFGSKVMVFGGAAWPNLYNDIFYYDVYDNHWTMAKNLPPYSRKQHTMHIYFPTPSTPTVVVFGGKHGSGGFSQNLHFYDINNARWSHPEGKGDVIPPVGHHASLVKDNNTLVVFGGFNGVESRNDVYTADLATSTWQKAQVTGNGPSPRHGHAVAFSAGRNFLLFGGVDCQGETCTFFNDMFSLSATTLAWSPVNISGIPPSPRASHSLTTITPTKHIVFGGISAEFTSHNDLYTYDEVNGLWTLEDVGGVAPEPRFGHTAALYDGNKVLIFGGGACRTIANCTFFNDVFVYNAITKAWTTLPVQGNVPAARLGAATDMLGQVLYVLGGATSDKMFGEFLVVQPDDPVPEKSIFFGTGKDGAVAGKNARFFLQLQDSFGVNRTTGGNNLRFEAIPSARKSLYLLEDRPVQVFVQDIGNGQYEIDYSTVVTDKYNITVYIEDVAAPSFVSTVVADLPSPNNTRARGSGLRACVAGEECKFRIELIDQYFNKLQVQSPVDVQIHGPKRVSKTLNDTGSGDVIMTYIPEKTGVYDIDIRLRAIDIQGSPFTLTVTPNLPSVKQSMVSGDGLSNSAAGDVAYATLVMFDDYNNPLLTGGDNVTAFLDGPDHVDSTVRDFGNGTYFIYYTAYKSGTYRFTVTINGKNLERSPFEVIVKPAPLSAATTFAYGTGLRYSVAGYRGYFTVQAADEFGNNMTVGGTKFNILFAGPGNYKQVCDITDHGNGKYSVSYISNIAGDFLISATIWNQALGYQSIHLSPFLGTTVASGADPAKSYIFIRSSADPVFRDSATFRAVTGVHNYFYIQAVDRYGNKKTTGGDRFTASVQGPSSIDGFVSDNNDGTYVGTYVAPAPGQYWLKILCGNVAVNGTPIAVRVRNNFDTCQNGCSGHGECRNNLCSCHVGYAGNDCSIETGNCPSNCMGNGACINSTCFCFPGYAGASCDKTVTLCPNDCSRRGQCINAQCVCGEGFDGVDCSNALVRCEDGCSGNGECVNGTCLCYPGFQGFNCAKKGLFCPRGCSGNGKCMTSGMCSCASGWGGVDCSTLVQLQDSSVADKRRALSPEHLPDRLPRR